MFVRKGTTLRKKHQSVRRPRRPSLPAQHPSDPEAGETSSVHLQSQQTGASSTSSASSTLTLDEDRNLFHHSTSYLTNESQQKINYGSILFQLQEAHDESMDLCDFLQRIWEIIWMSLVLTVILLLLFGLPISMIAVGTSYLRDCPKEPKIPIYLLVGGAFGTIHICIILWQQKRSRDCVQLDDNKDDDDTDDDDVMTRSYRFTGYILSLFLLLWFVLGNYWLFSIWQPNFAQPLHEPRNWCSRQLYNYAFYQLLVCYSLLGVLILGFLGCLAAYIIAVRRK